jgi:hypothetical protein
MRGCPAGSARRWCRTFGCTAWWGGGRVNEPRVVMDPGSNHRRPTSCAHHVCGSMPPHPLILFSSCPRLSCRHLSYLAALAIRFLHIPPPIWVLRVPRACWGTPVAVNPPHVESSHIRQRLQQTGPQQPEPRGGSQRAAQQAQQAGGTDRRLNDLRRGGRVGVG